MKLPSIVYQDGIRKGTQVKFGEIGRASCRERVSDLV